MQAQPSDAPTNFNQVWTDAAFVSSVKDTSRQSFTKLETKILEEKFVTMPARKTNEKQNVVTKTNGEVVFIT